jgi:cell shape-determining protein MreC
MRLPRPSPYRSLTLVVALLVIALLLLVLDQGGMLGSFRAQAQTLLTPLTEPLRRLGDSVGGVGQSLTEAQQLRDRVAALEQENSRLKAENIQIQELRLRLDQLETQLRIEKQHAWQLLGADVSARSPDGPKRSAACSC